MRLHPVFQTGKERAAISQEEQGRIRSTKGTHTRDVGYGNRRCIFPVKVIVITAGYPS